MAHKKLEDMIAGSPALYASLIYDKFYEANQCALPTDSILDTPLEAIEDLYHLIKSLIHKILQLDSVGPVYQVTADIVKRFQEVLGFLEDMKTESLLSSAALIARHEEGSLLYQNAQWYILVHTWY